MHLPTGVTPVALNVPAMPDERMKPFARRGSSMPLFDVIGSLSDDFLQSPSCRSFFLCIYGFITDASIDSDVSRTEITTTEPVAHLNTYVPTSSETSPLQEGDSHILLISHSAPRRPVSVPG